MTQCALVVAVILKCLTFLAVISENSTVSFIFPLTSLLSSLYWPWDPLSSLESTLVSILVPKQVDCIMCRFSKLLLFVFFFCKVGSDRLIKRASYSCCNFLCVVLAAAYLKYRRCLLSCFPFFWHFFSLWHTHTPLAHTHKQVKFTIFILHKQTNSSFGSVEQNHYCKHDKVETCGQGVRKTDVQGMGEELLLTENTFLQWQART